MRPNENENRNVIESRRRNKNEMLAIWSDSAVYMKLFDACIKLLNNKQNNMLCYNSAALFIIIIYF